MNQDQDFDRNDRRDDGRSERGQRPAGRRDDDRKNYGRSAADSRPPSSRDRDNDRGPRREGGAPWSADRNDSREDGPRKPWGDRDNRESGNRFNSGSRDSADRKPFARREGDAREGGFGRNSEGRSPFKRDDRRTDGPREGGFNRSGGSSDRDRNPAGRWNEGTRGGGSDRFGSERRSNERDGKSREGGFNRDRPGRPEGGRPDRSGDKPRFARDEPSRGSVDRRDRAPREGGFNRDRNDQGDAGSRSNNAGRFGGERRFDDRQTGADRKPFARREGDAREGGFGRNSEGRSPFKRDDRRTDGPREGGFNRSGGSSDRDRNPAGRWNEGTRGGGSDRFGSERRSNERDGKSREGGFNRDRPGRPEGGRPDRSGDKPRFARDDNDRKGGSFGEKAPGRFGRDEQPRDKGAKPLDNEFDKRFSEEQREDSRGRQVGKFKRAPDYNKTQFPKLDLNKKTPGKKFDKPRGERDSKYAGARAAVSREADDRDPSGLMRLNRYIANAGVCSRREADELISRGDITVNGKAVTEMGYKVQESDIVKYGKTTLNPEKLVYVLLNKPKDYLTTTEDPEERRTVMELVADAGNFRIYPVGRLDRNTTGLLLMTNDGELADKLTHPSNNVRKIYQAELDKPITAEDFETLRAGIELEDGPIKPDDLALVTPDGYVVGIEIHSGRNRIVRRIFEHLGYEVTKLDRTIYAGLSKKELPRGKWRFLEPKEVIKLKYLN